MNCWGICLLLRRKLSSLKRLINIRNRRTHFWFCEMAFMRGWFLFWIRFLSLKCFQSMKWKFTLCSMCKGCYWFWLFMSSLRFWCWLLAISSSIEVHHIGRDISLLVRRSNLIIHFKGLHCTITTCCRNRFLMLSLRNKTSWRSFYRGCSNWSNIFCWNRIRMRMHSMQNFSWGLKLFYRVSLFIVFIVLSKSLYLSFVVLFKLVDFIH